MLSHVIRFVFICAECLWVCFVYLSIRIAAGNCLVVLISVKLYVSCYRVYLQCNCLSNKALVLFLVGIT